MGKTGKTNYQTASQRLVLLCIFPELHDSSHRGSRALATRLEVLYVGQPETLWAPFFSSMSGPAYHTQNPRVILPYKTKSIFRHIRFIQTYELYVELSFQSLLELTGTEWAKTFDPHFICTLNMLWWIRHIKL